MASGSETLTLGGREEGLPPAVATATEGADVTAMSLLSAPFTLQRLRFDDVLLPDVFGLALSASSIYGSHFMVQ